MASPGTITRRGPRALDPLPCLGLPRGLPARRADLRGMGRRGGSPHPMRLPPDIVERLRDHIGAALPANGRAWGPGIPARVQPQRGVIWATGLGTHYGVRVPLDLIADAIPASREDHARLARRRHDGSSKKTSARTGCSAAGGPTRSAGVTSSANYSPTRPEAPQPRREFPRGRSPAQLRRSPTPHPPVGDG